MSEGGSGEEWVVRRRQLKWLLQNGYYFAEQRPMTKKDHQLSPRVTPPSVAPLSPLILSFDSFSTLKA